MKCSFVYKDEVRQIIDSLQDMLMAADEAASNDASIVRNRTLRDVHMLLDAASSMCQFLIETPTIEAVRERESLIARKIVRQ